MVHTYERNSSFFLVYLVTIFLENPGILRNTLDIFGYIPNFIWQRMNKPYSVQGFAISRNYNDNDNINKEKIIIFISRG